MKDDRDPPIEPQTFLGGVKVVDIGDVRVARGFSRRHHSSCPHRSLVYDSQERRIWCKDCEKDVDAFDAFSAIVGHFHTAEERIELRRKAVEEAESHALVSRASKAVDSVWRRHKMAPCCQVCGRGILPEDFANGVSSRVSREFERARRDRERRS